MITEAELLEHKWRKIEDKCWEKLGVRIEYPIIITAFPAIKITYYINPKQESSSAVYVSVSVNINTLEATIRTLIKGLFKVELQKYPTTPKQKRTLKNWIL